MGSRPFSSPPQPFTEVALDEERVLFDVSATGATVIFSNNISNSRVMVVEVALEIIVANTVQLRLGISNVLTPAWDLTARMTYVDPGFVMEAAERLFLVCGGAGQVIGYVRFKRLDDLLSPMAKTERDHGP